MYGMYLLYFTFMLKPTKHINKSVLGSHRGFDLFRLLTYLLVYMYIDIFKFYLSLAFETASIFYFYLYILHFLCQCNKHTIY